jgi:hypothetical protein
MLDWVCFFMELRYSAHPNRKQPAMKITINEPCHENWEAMTPNQQGAFCKSCMKDVVDFSKKTVGEIKEFFSKPQGKVCGRFEEKQLQELSFDDFFSRFTYWNFSRKFAVIFFMAFGFWIFSHQGAYAQNEMFMKGDVAYVPEKSQAQTQTEPVAKVLGQATVKRAEPVVMGKIKCIKPETARPPVKQAPAVKEQKMVKGKIAVVKPAGEPRQAKPPVKNIPVTEPVKVVDEKNIIMGAIAYYPEEQKRPVKEVEVKTVCVKEPLKVVDAEAEKSAVEKAGHDKVVILYPNPNNGFFTVETKEKKSLVILDATGKIVHMQTVEGSTPVNASHLPSGAYTISLSGPGKTTHSKIIISR